VALYREAAMAEETQLWLWQYTDEFGKRRRSTWLMTEEQAKHYKDAVKVEDSLEIRRSPGSTSDLNRSPRTS
jgi:hypothetical protein